MKSIRVALIGALVLAACAPVVTEEEMGFTAGDRVSRSEFGTLPDARLVHAWEITNANGLRVRAIDYGGIVLSIEVPDREGNLGDIALGYESLDAYLQIDQLFGQ